MSLDAGPIGGLALALMEDLEAEHGERGEVKLRAAIVIADVAVRASDGDTWTHVQWKFGQASEAWDLDQTSSAYAAGLVVQALRGLTEGQEDLPE